MKHHTQHGCRDLSRQNRGPVIEFDNQWGIWNCVRTNEATSGAMCSVVPPYGCVDWNKMSLRNFLEILSRTPRGCVDWNVTLGDVYCSSFALTWVRGLKYGHQTLLTDFFSRTPHGCVDWNAIFSYTEQLQRLSHPARVRGLKWWSCNSWKCWRLSHHKDAWIEIFLVFQRDSSSLMTSHSTRVRGLKWLTKPRCHACRNVTPHTGAWIKFWTFHVKIEVRLSTFDNQWDIWNYVRTNEVTSGAMSPVVPHTGAWIEI